METQRKCGITASDIDAMTGEELLELAKAQGQYVGRQLPTEEKGGVYARVLDAPRFLRRLIQVHPKQFTKTLAKLYVPDSVQWSAVALSQGLGVHNLSVMERSMPAVLAHVKALTSRGSGGTCQMVVERSGALDSALLLKAAGPVEEAHESCGGKAADPPTVHPGPAPGI